MLVDTAEPQVSASYSVPDHNFTVGLASRENGDDSKRYGSAQYFHGVAADAYISDAFPFPRCSDVDFARATAFDALLNHHLLITVCDAVLDHPTGSAACSRSGGWIFTAVEKHSSSSF